MEIIQPTSQPIDVAYWIRDEEFAQYPEGARDKTLLYCPKQAPSDFLKPDRRYLFKRSSHRYLEQFWVEILAYRLGAHMDINVPPAFVAYDSKEKQSGALIEWFLYPVGALGVEEYIAGGDYCQQYISNFDRKKGKQHNFETVSQIFEDLVKKYPAFDADWKTYWAKAFLFDALIGNTDRHQDNWGTIATLAYQGNETPKLEKMRISPVFDNGTSMGYEIFPGKFKYYEEKDHLEKYVSKGWHHMKWSIDSAQMGHIEMLQKFINKYPETRQIMLNCLNKLTVETFKLILNELVSFDVPVRLTAERANFMLKLLQFRHQHLLTELEK
jgi:hypothetical protein